MLRVGGTQSDSSFEQIPHPLCSKEPLLLSVWETVVGSDWGQQRNCEQVHRSWVCSEGQATGFASGLDVGFCGLIIRRMELLLTPLGKLQPGGSWGADLDLAVALGCWKCQTHHHTFPSPSTALLSCLYSAKAHSCPVCV